jgi:hypothetical protein
MCRSLISLPTVGSSGSDSPKSLVHHRTVRWFLAAALFGFPESDEFVAKGLGRGADDTPDSPVIFSHSPRWFPRAASSPQASLGHRTVRCARLELVLAVLSHIFSNSNHFFSTMFLGTSMHMLVLKTIY